MNKTLIALSVALSLGAATSANAADATINFTGTIDATSCTISTGSGTDTDVKLRQVTLASANGNDHRPRETAFTLTLGTATSKCPGSTATITFDNPQVDSNGNLTNTSAKADKAANASLAIHNSTGKVDLAGTLDATGVNGIYTYNLSARYEKSGGDIEAGDFVAALPLSVAYN